MQTFTDVQIREARRAVGAALNTPELITLRGEYQNAYGLACLESRNRARALRFLETDVVGTARQDDADAFQGAYHEARASALAAIGLNDMGSQISPVLKAQTTEERRLAMKSRLFPPADWGRKRWPEEVERIHAWRTLDDQGRPLGNEAHIAALVTEWEALNG